MTILDSAGKPVGDLPAQPRRVNVDMAAIAQRAGIARSHPMESQRTAAKNLLIDDVEILLAISKALHDQLGGLKERHGQLLANATTSGTLLALILTEIPEFRWTKAFVAAFEVVGGWILEDDPADPETWLLRLGEVPPIVSAVEQTVPQETIEGDGAVHA